MSTPLFALGAEVLLVVNDLVAVFVLVEELHHDEDDPSWIRWALTAAVIEGCSLHSEIDHQLETHHHHRKAMPKTGEVVLVMVGDSELRSTEESAVAVVWFVSHSRNSPRIVHRNC